MRKRSPYAVPYGAVPDTVDSWVMLRVESVVPPLTWIPYALLLLAWVKPVTADPCVMQRVELVKPALK